MASERFQFHYVRTPTGSISGASFLKQTEDAINDLGDFVHNVNLDVSSALQFAEQAKKNAETALNNSNAAVNTSNAALTKVTTLEVTVNSWGVRIQAAESNSSTALSNSTQAIGTSNSALEYAQRAVATANSARSTSQEANANSQRAVSASTQALQTAGSALDTARQAVETAREAERDTGAALDQMNALIETAREQAQISTTKAQDSAASEAKAKQWAEGEGEVEPGQYSAKYWALNAIHGYAVKYVPQTLTTEEQLQARTNIGMTTLSNSEIDALFSA